jgi:nitrite reductase/ring-hydroxylating ferredoxin subunit
MNQEIVIGDLAQIPRGEGRTFAVGSRRVAVFHTGAGVFATQADCPHLRGPLADGLTGGTTLICPLHERAYDLRTGQAMDGACEGIQVYPASLGEDGKIRLTIEAPAAVVAGGSAVTSSEHAMKSFIRVAEIWVPTKDRTQLEFLDGLYGPLTEFRAISQSMQFGFDEGLPGKAWATGHPVILKAFENSYFRRTQAAHAAGLTCGVALPVFAGDVLQAVVVLFCGDDKAHIGAIELWHNDPDTSYEMRLADGYYGTAEMFEFNSRHTKFPRGFGLPGRVWKANMPLLVKDLYNSKSFLRWQEAVEVGINRGLGIPYPHPSGQTWVATFLSALDTPIARRFEIWTPREDGKALVFKAGDCDQSATLAEDYAAVAITKGDGTIGQVWAGGLPAVRASLADDLSAPSRSAIAVGLNTLVAVPILDAHGLKAVVAWYL